MEGRRQSCLSSDRVLVIFLSLGGSREAGWPGWPEIQGRYLPLPSHPHCRVTTVASVDWTPSLVLTQALYCLHHLPRYYFFFLDRDVDFGDSKLHRVISNARFRAEAGDSEITHNGLLAPLLISAPNDL